MNEDRIKKYRKNMILSDGSAFLPKRAVFYPTLRCNLHCKMCFQNKHDRNIEELSIDQIEKIFSGMKLSSLHLVGGEIFVRKDIYSILEYFNSIIPNITLQTNGTLIKQDGIEKLKGFDNIKALWISVDGCKETHDSIRGNGSFDKALDVINKLKDYKKIIINTVIMKENINQLVELYEYFNRLGVDKIVFQFQMIYSRKKQKNTQEKLQEQGIASDMCDDCVVDNLDMAYMEYLKPAIQELRKKEDRTKIEFFPALFEENVDEYITGTVLEGKRVVCSDIIESVLKINTKGNLILCEALSCEFDNLLDVPFEEQWNCDKVKRLRKALIKNNLVDMCSRCCCLDYL